MGLDRLATALRAAGWRMRRGALVGGVVAVLVATAFGFLTAALYLALAGAAGAIAACLAIAGAYLVIALVVYLAARSTAQAPPARAAGPEPDAISQLIDTFLAGVRAGREGFGRDRRP